MRPDCRSNSDNSTFSAWGFKSSITILKTNVGGDMNGEDVDCPRSCKPAPSRVKANLSVLLTPSQAGIKLLVMSQQA